ncbi:hypothetical protein MW887_000503 [Aspergillus wentii]|nr:hypothetical protein MW887_000503 [Aspergillus wentii]
MSHRNHRFDPIVIDDDDDEDDEAGGMQVDFSHQQRQRGMFGYDTPDHIRGSPSIYHTSIEQEKKVRSRLREERHAALSVLMDRELLMVQALAAQETLPQTRRRFLTKLIAPEDPDIAASIRADRFIIQAQPQYSASSSSSSNTVPVPVCRNIVDVCETDDAGWMKPKPKTREMASSSPSDAGSGEDGEGEGVE